MTHVIKVTSPSFSSHPLLCQALQQKFKSVFLNADGRRYRDHELVSYLDGADGAIIGLEQLDRSILEGLRTVKVIAKYGVGLDNIDLVCAKRLGITVLSSPGVNRLSVAELTLAFMIGLLRNVFLGNQRLKERGWKKEGGCQLTGKTVGIIGCGFIGTEVARLLQPFQCRILINDILDKSDVAKKYNAHLASFEEVLYQADIVTLHVPLTEITHHFLNEKTIGFMKPTACLINTSRGSVVHQQALKEALQRGTIRAAALDVFEQEPPEDDEFLKLENLIVTPHIGGNSQEAVLAMGQAAIQNLVGFFSDRRT